MNNEVKGFTMVRIERLPGRKWIRDHLIPTGEIHGAKLIPYSIPSDRIPTGAVKNWHIPDNEVDGVKIKDASIDASAKLIDGSVTTVKIADGAITTAKVADAAITEAKIADAAVTTAKIADAAVTYAKIPSGEIPSNRLKVQIIDVDSVPDVDSEYSHNLGVTPSIVWITPRAGDVTGYGILVTKSATSVTVRANTSGVNLTIILMA